MHQRVIYNNASRIEDGRGGRLGRKVGRFTIEWSPGDDEKVKGDSRSHATVERAPEKKIGATVKNYLQLVRLHGQTT